MARQCAKSVHWAGRRGCGGSAITFKQALANSWINVVLLEYHHEPCKNLPRTHRAFLPVITPPKSLLTQAFSQLRHLSPPYIFSAYSMRPSLPQSRLNVFWRLSFFSLPIHWSGPVHASVLSLFPPLEPSSLSHTSFMLKMHHV